MSEYWEEWLQDILLLLLPHALETGKHDTLRWVYCHLTPLIGIEVLEIETVACGYNLEPFLMLVVAFLISVLTSQHPAVWLLSGSAKNDPPIFFMHMSRSSGPQMINMWMRSGEGLFANEVSIVPHEGSHSGKCSCVVSPWLWQGCNLWTNNIRHPVKTC